MIFNAQVIVKYQMPHTKYGYKSRNAYCVIRFLYSVVFFERPIFFPRKYPLHIKKNGTANVKIQYEQKL